MTDDEKNHESKITQRSPNLVPFPGKVGGLFTAQLLVALKVKVTFGLGEGGKGTFDEGHDLCPHQRRVVVHLHGKHMQMYAVVVVHRHINHIKMFSGVEVHLYINHMQMYSGEQVDRHGSF